VRIRRPAWQQRLRPVRCDDEGGDLVVRRGREADLGRENTSAHGARRLKEQAELRVAEGHGDLSARADAGHRTRTEIDTGRAIDGDPDSGASVHGLDQARRPLLGGARAVGPQDAIQDHGGTRERGLRPVPGRHRDVPAVRQRGIRRPVSGLDGEHLTAPAAQRAQRDVGTAPLVPAPYGADDPALRQKLLDDRGDRAAGTLHQEPLGHTVLLARPPLDLGHLGRAQQRQPLNAVQIAHRLSTGEPRGIIEWGTASGPPRTPPSWGS